MLDRADYDYLTSSDPHSPYYEPQSAPREDFDDDESFWTNAVAEALKGAISHVGGTDGQ